MTLRRFLILCLLWALVGVTKAQGEDLCGMVLLPDARVFDLTWVDEDQFLATIEIVQDGHAVYAQKRVTLEDDTPVSVEDDEPPDPELIASVVAIVAQSSEMDSVFDADLDSQLFLSPDFSYALYRNGYALFGVDVEHSRVTLLDVDLPVGSVRHIEWLDDVSVFVITVPPYGIGTTVFRLCPEFACIDVFSATVTEATKDAVNYLAHSVDSNMIAYQSATDQSTFYVQTLDDSAEFRTLQLDFHMFVDMPAAGAMHSDTLFIIGRDDHGDDGIYRVELGGGEDSQSIVATPDPDILVQTRVWLVDEQVGMSFHALSGVPGLGLHVMCW